MKKLITIPELERRIIIARLKRFNGSVAQTAKSLDVCDRTIRNKMKEYAAWGDRCS